MYSFYEVDIDRRETIAYLVYNNITDEFELGYIDENRSIPIEVWVDNYFGFILIKNLYYEYITGNKQKFKDILHDFREICPALNIDHTQYLIRYY